MWRVECLPPRAGTAAEFRVRNDEGMRVAILWYRASEVAGLRKEAHDMANEVTTEEWGGRGLWNWGAVLILLGIIVIAAFFLPGFIW